MDSSPVSILRMLTRLNIGGPARHATLLSTQLDPQRFSTCLVVGEPDPTEGDLSGVMQGKGARVIRVKHLRRAIRPWADLLAFFRLLSIVWRERPQLIHTHMAKAGALGRLAGLCYNRLGPGRVPARRTVLIHTFHGHVLDGYFPAWLSRCFLLIERWLARWTDCLIAVSPTVQRELSAQGIGRAAQWRVIPLGLPLAPLADLPLSNGTQVIRFGLVGRLVPIKNPSLFLEALHRFVQHRERGTVRGMVVGDGPLRPALEQQAQALGLVEVVRFTGWQHDLSAVYRGLDVVCLTSWNEGTPVALIEAMAAGRIVVATQVGGVGDLLGAPGDAVNRVPSGGFRITNRGVLVRPGDPDGLANAMASVGTNATLRRRLGESARTYVVHQFSAERLVRDMTALYEELNVGRGG